MFKPQFDHGALPPIWAMPIAQYNESFFCEVFLEYTCENHNDVGLMTPLSLKQKALT